jgi:hypothetical protein
MATIYYKKKTLKKEENPSTRSVYIRCTESLEPSTVDAAALYSTNAQMTECKIWDFANKMHVAMWKSFFTYASGTNIKFDYGSHNKWESL